MQPEPGKRDEWAVLMCRRSILDKIDYSKPTLSAWTSEVATNVIGLGFVCT
jgi:hypothetical protein